MFGKLGLVPHEQRRVPVDSKGDCAKSRCPPVKDKCPRHGGVCLTVSDCGDGERADKGGCYCTIMIGCKAKQEIIDVEVENFPR